MAAVMQAAMAVLSAMNIATLIIAMMPIMAVTLALVSPILAMAADGIKIIITPVLVSSSLIMAASAFV